MGLACPDRANQAATTRGAQAGATPHGQYGVITLHHPAHRRCSASEVRKHDASETSLAKPASDKPASAKHALAKHALAKPASAKYALAEHALARSSLIHTLDLNLLTPCIPAVDVVCY